MPLLLFVKADLQTLDRTVVVAELLRKAYDVNNQTYSNQLDTFPNSPFKSSNVIMLGQTLSLGCAMKNALQMCTEGSNISSLSCTSRLLGDPSVSYSSLVWQARLLARRKIA